MAAAGGGGIMGVYLLFGEPLVLWARGLVKPVPLATNVERADLWKVLEGSGLHLKFTESVATTQAFHGALTSRSRVLLFM
jgi:hypothetical protein